MPKKVTVADIAAESGVSSATVSRVLHHPELVDNLTAARVRDVAEKLEYPRALSQLATTPVFGGTSATAYDEVIVLALPRYDNPFYGEVIHGAQDATQAAGRQLLVSYDPISPANIDRMGNLLGRERVVGLISMCPMTVPLLEHLEAWLPVIQCGEYAKGGDAPYITIDDSAAALTATDHLIDCGCSNLAILCGPESFKYSRERLSGFERSAEKHGIAVMDSHVIHLPDNSFDVAFSAVTHLLGEKDAPDGIFTYSDSSAAAAIRAAQKLGKLVPQDLQVVGFDNTDTSSMVTPSITTISQPRYQMGYSACTMLFERLRGTNGTGTRMTLGTELIVRESTSMAAFVR